MSYVVERCPSCGVEHDLSVGGECEACGALLRAWCRRHGRDVGWLDTSSCPRCAEEAARPRPAPPSRASGSAPTLVAAPSAPPVFVPAESARPRVAGSAAEPAPFGEAGAPVRRRTGCVTQLVEMGLVSLVIVLVCWLAGMGFSVLYAISLSTDVSQLVAEWGRAGAVVGGGLAGLACIFYQIGIRTPPREEKK